jgi:hypothetical protein
VNALPINLVRAARSLEERFELLHVPSRKIPEAEWTRLPEAIKRLIPPWIQILLKNHSLAGGVLEYRDRTRTYVRQFAFFEPPSFESGFEEGSLLLRLIRFGLVPFANEADGNVWVVGLDEGPTSAIYLLELSGWNGAEPDKANGLVFATRTLAHLLAAMAVSEASYYNGHESKSCVLWSRGIIGGSL